MARRSRSEGSVHQVDGRWVAVLELPRKANGKRVRRRRFAPTVSPNKTYAGLIGGFVSTVVFAWMLGPSLTLLDAPRSLLAGILISLAGFAGDLCFSALKRDLGIKDFSATLPGHGGVLDRVDSLVFTAPLFFHFVYYGYGP